MKQEFVFDFKIVDEDDRSSQNTTIYDDKIDERYNYDSKVPNYKQVKVGDKVIIRNKDIVYGTSVVEYINIVDGTKDMHYCPFCDSYNFEPRKIKRPLYRCYNKHEFDEPKTIKAKVKKVTAFYAREFKWIHVQVPKSLLNDYYVDYNQTNSINKLKPAIIDQLSKLNGPGVRSESKGYLGADDASELNDTETEYLTSIGDEREVITKQIKARRGQKKFRNDLRKRYGQICMVTGCEILDIIEAAHINPYRGKNDHHPSNGLLLRSDIHTLFDLNLIGIEPETLHIHLHPSARSEYGLYHNKRLILNGKKPDKFALLSRWTLYIKRGKI